MPLWRRIPVSPAAGGSVERALVSLATCVGHSAPSSHLRVGLHGDGMAWGRAILLWLFLEKPELQVECELLGASLWNGVSPNSLLSIL